MVRDARRAAAEIAVPEHLMPIWDAFDLLCHGRQLGMSSVQRLTISEIDACRRMLDIPQALRFCRLIQAMDTVYIDAFQNNRPKR